jgi:anthraniloyl-CoA monooxygenase
MQLGHSGRKGSTQLGWERMDHPLEAGNWPVISASPIPYYEGISQVPREINQADMKKIVDDFVRSTRFAEQAGFDMLELHMAHGYLLASFISPLTNQRTDRYGGAIENRMRFPLEVFRACRAAWPQAKPMSVRISATDWAPGGLSGEDLIALTRMLKEPAAT